MSISIHWSMPSLRRKVFRSILPISRKGRVFRTTAWFLHGRPIMWDYDWMIELKDIATD